MEFIIELAFELIFLPIGGIFESLAGILHETEDPKIRRVQRICAWIFMFSVVVVLIGIAAAWFGVWKLALPLFVAGGVGLFIAGCVGNHMEALMKQKRN